jgi:hypothetical protein
MTSRLLRWSLLATLAFVAAPAVLTAADQRPRLLVLTDVGGDPDDQQSLIRLMLYSNEFQIEGLVASAAGVPGELKEAVTRPELIRRIVEAYGQVQPNLALHAAGYPLADELLACIKSGNPRRGQGAIGAGHDTEGSNWILRAADRDDERPLNMTIWGGQTDLAQALWRVRTDRGEEGLKKVISRLRVYDIGDQDGIQPWLFEQFPDLFYVMGKPLPGRDKREASYRGMYLGGDESLTSLAWLDEHVRQNHGPLGALYPAKTWTAPNPHSALKEGDTPSWLFFRPIALQDPAHPEWGGLGGRFQRAERGLWRDVPDVIDGKPDPRASVWRWRPVVQRDFQARLDWCVKPAKEANHAPVVVFGDATRPLVRSATAGETVSLSARGTDPDGDRLNYRWWHYRDASPYTGAVKLVGQDTNQLSIVIPADARGNSLHLIFEATDSGTPPLTTLCRVVLNVE